MAIEKFEKGKWYKYTSKERGLGWTDDMDVVLDGEPHLCTDDKRAVYQTPHMSNNLFAAFDGGAVKDWWGDGINFEEVSHPKA